MPISPWLCKPERELNFSSCSIWVEQVPKKRFRVYEGVCDWRPNFEPQFGHHFLLKLMSLVLLESVWNTLSEYIYLWVAVCNFASQKVTASKQKLVKSALFHILSAHAKGKSYQSWTNCTPKSSQNYFWHNDSVCPDVWAHWQGHFLPTSRINRKNVSENAHVIK